MQVLSGNYKFEDQEGNLLVEAPVMDLYCTIGLAAAESGQSSQINQLKYAAKVVNTEYGTSLTWGQVQWILHQIDEEMENSKKNSTSTLESPAGTESTPSS